MMSAQETIRYHINFLVGPRTGVTFNYVVAQPDWVNLTDIFVVNVTSRDTRTNSAFEQFGEVISTLSLTSARCHKLTYEALPYGAAEVQRLRLMIALINQWLRDRHEPPPDQQAPPLARQAPTRAQQAETFAQRERARPVAHHSRDAYLANLVELYLAAPNQPAIDLTHPSKYKRMRNQVLNLSRGQATAAQITIVCAELERRSRSAPCYQI